MEQIIADNNDMKDDLPPKSARKAVHVEALSNLLLQDQNHDKQSGETKSVNVKEETPEVLVSYVPLPPPLISAEEAAREKAESGENRAVEHIAELSKEQAAKALSSSTPLVAVKTESMDRIPKKKCGGNGKKADRKRSTSAEESVQAADGSDVRRTGRSRRRLRL